MIVFFETWKLYLSNFNEIHGNCFIESFKKNLQTVFIMCMCQQFFKTPTIIKRNYKNYTSPPKWGQGSTGASQQFMWLSTLVGKIKGIIPPFNHNSNGGVGGEIMLHRLLGTCVCVCVSRNNALIHSAHKHTHTRPRYLDGSWGPVAGLQQKSHLREHDRRGGRCWWSGFEEGVWRRMSRPLLY